MMRFRAPAISPTFAAREMKIAAALLGCNQTWKAALDKVTEEYLLDALDTRNP